MSDQLIYHAIEQGVAATITQFEQMPDLFMGNADLKAVFFHSLQQQPVLTTRQVTRDGRRTVLLHREYPRFFAEGPLSILPRSGRGECYDVAVLEPNFVSGQPLATVANVNGRGARALRHLDTAARPVPLLAAVNLCLIEDFDPPARAELEYAYHQLASGHADLAHGYLVVFCRHWDLERHVRPMFDLLEGWAASRTWVSVVAVQSYHDDVGRMFGGRYFNLWQRTAPLPPIDLPYPALARSSMNHAFALF
jgi:hypothetical protein